MDGTQSRGNTHRWCVICIHYIYVFWLARWNRFNLVGKQLGREKMVLNTHWPFIFVHWTWTSGHIASAIYSFATVITWAYSVKCTEYYFVLCMNMNLFEYLHCDGRATHWNLIDAVYAYLLPFEWTCTQQKRFCIYIWPNWIDMREKKIQLIFNGVRESIENFGESK